MVDSTKSAGRLAGAASYKKRLQVAKKLAREAGELVMRAFRNAEFIEFKQKPDLTPVGTLDDKLERKLRERIREDFPRDTVHGEELGTEEADNAYDPEAYTWILDPLDGTRNFLVGLPSFCVSIAIVRDQVPLAAVVYDPLHEEFFEAEREQGAALNGHPLTRPTVVDTLLPFGWSHSPGTPYGEFLSGLEVIHADGRQPWDSGSASIMLCYVAAGRLAGCAETALPIWDTLPGLLIAQEAGYATSALQSDIRAPGPAPMYAYGQGCAALARRLVQIGQPKARLV